MKVLSRKRACALFFLILIFTHNKSFADQGFINISATVIVGSKCWFLGASSTTINLGTLIPGSGLDVTGTASLTFKCQGKDIISYSITDDDGLFESVPGMHRLKHITENEFIEYTFDYDPKNEVIRGRGQINITRTLNITATVTHNAYQDALVGNYYDTVTLTILP